MLEVVDGTILGAEVDSSSVTVFSGEVPRARALEKGEALRFRQISDQVAISWPYRHGVHRTYSGPLSPESGGDTKKNRAGWSAAWGFPDSFPVTWGTQR